MHRAVFSLVLALPVPLGALAVEQPAPPPMPPVEVRAKGGEWGSEKWTWEGVSIVADAANKETLFLCGRVGGAEFGSIGSWALAEDGKTWREMKSASPILDPLRG